MGVLDASQDPYSSFRGAVFINSPKVEDGPHEGHQSSSATAVHGQKQRRKKPDDGATEPEFTGKEGIRR
jgi:hypothetical protein